MTEIGRLSDTHQLIAIVGDGVNDAPTMARADIYITMGATGSTVTLETRDIALMSDNLDQVPFAVRLSRATSRIIRQSLIATLAVVASLVATILASLTIIGAVVLIHES